MTYLVTFLIVLSLILPAMSVELFRHRGAAKDGGTLEYVFEAGEQNSPNNIRIWVKSPAAEVAYMTCSISGHAPSATTLANCESWNRQKNAFRGFSWPTASLSGRKRLRMTYASADYALKMAPSLSKTLQMRAQTSSEKPPIVVMLRLECGLRLRASID
jgi:hypothetical protein